MEAPQIGKMKLEPLKITCTSTDCDNGLHCFRASQKQGVTKVGACRECGAQLIDWSRVHKKDLTDAQYTFEALKYELIRHKFWHVPINSKAVNYAHRKGISGLERAVRSRLRTSVGVAKPFRDGTQTSMEDSPNPIHHAQHATASCCRKCIEYWHDIPRARPLTDEEIEYLAELVMLYLKERLPNLSDRGVPPIRRAP